MNKISYKFNIWRLRRIMIKSSKMDKKALKLANKIKEWEEKTITL